MLFGRMYIDSTAGFRMSYCKIPAAFWLNTAVAVAALGHPFGCFWPVWQEYALTPLRTLTRLAAFSKLYILCFALKTAFGNKVRGRFHGPYCAREKNRLCR